MSGTTPYLPYTAASPTIQSPSPNPTGMTTSFSSLGTTTPTRGRPRGGLTGTGLKRGRKPRGSTLTTPVIPHITSPDGLNTTSTATSTASFPSTSTQSYVQWALPNSTTGSTTQASTNGTTAISSPTIPASTSSLTTATGDRSSTPVTSSFTSSLPSATVAQLQALTQQARASTPQTPTSATTATPGSTLPATYTLPSGQTIDVRSLLSSAAAASAGSSAFATATAPAPLPSTIRPTAGADEDVEGDDELLPAMADDDYSAQLSFQSQSKDNLKVLMDNFSPAQYDRFEAYRRHALPKQAVRKVIQQTLGQQVSQPVAQIVAGFAKVFVGEIIEKARAVQERRGETGPLSPDHLREAYRMYQEETGRVGAARPLRSKRLFVR